MNPTAAANLAARGAQLLPRIFPTLVIFRGAEIIVPRPAVDPSFVLGNGGFREGAIFRIRFPANVQPPPAVKEPIQDIRAQRTYYVISCRPGVEGTAASEHLVEAALP